MQYATDFRVETKTREQATYEVLRRAIIQGRWTDNEPLVASRLATELGVSRITVANAFKRLSGEGFIKLVPHKEAVVAPLDRTDIRQIYLMRAELEALSAREATLHVDQRDLDELHAINTKLGKIEQSAKRDVRDMQAIGHSPTWRGVDEGDVRDMRAIDFAFHRRLRQVAAMPLLASTLDNLADQSEGYRARLLDSFQIAMPTTSRHQPILAALESRDAAAAAEYMRQHVLEGMEVIMTMLDRT
jgi:DNA-binding GntR family transcriptional regulator